MSAKGRRKTRRKGRRKGWPSLLSAALYRPDWLPDDTWLRASVGRLFLELRLNQILQVMRENPPDPRKLAEAADELVECVHQLQQPPDAKRETREQRRLDAQRIKKRVDEVRKELAEIKVARPPHAPTLTDHAWQFVAEKELRLLPRLVRRARDRAAPQDKDAAERRAYDELYKKGAATSEAKTLRRWVERNR